MFNPYRNYLTLRRYRQIIMNIGKFGFGELAGRLNLLGRLRLRRSLKRQRSMTMSRAERFRMLLEQLGPSFVKLGQILSMRPDLLPHDIIDELSRLQNRVTPVAWETMSRRLRDSLGPDYMQRFSEFDTTPVASASIAQVYVARLKTGEKVAVKVVRPGTEKIFRDDLVILEHLASLAHTHIPESRQWNLEGIIAQFRGSLHHELDLRHEGRNADIFRNNFQDDSKIYVPKIYWNHSTDKVLVMEFVEGSPLSDFFGEQVPESTRRELAKTGADAVLKQVFIHGFFQADPHPGNALVMENNVICFLDFGMFGRLDVRSLAALARAMHAITKKDIDKLIRAMRDLAMLPERELLPELRIALTDLMEQYYGIPLKQISMGRLLRDIVGLISRFNVGVRHDFLFLTKALTTIEATGCKLDPDFDMIGHARPFIQDMMVKRYSPGQVLSEGQGFAEDLALLLREAPDNTLEIIRKIRDGRLRVEFHHKGLEESMTQLNQMSDKLTLGIIIGSLIIASTVMSHAKLGPTLFGMPVIGGFGFLIAGVTGLWFIFDIIRSRR